MDHQLDTAKHALISYSSSSSIITALDSTTDNSCVQHQHHNGSFISLRCRPTLITLPPELLSKISYSLSLCEYSFLSRTCSRLHSHLFHSAELVLFLKTRYRLSIQSGSIIIFAYLANMQFKAPLLLERIFEDFFADSPLRLQEEQKWKLHCQQQRQQLNNNTYQLNQAILSRVDSGSNNSSENGTSLEYQRMDGIELHKVAEKARRQAKSDAVRMLGVLYALDKTHIGPSSSTNALVLSGACDPPEPAPPAPAPAPTPSTVTETETATALETTTTSSSLPAFTPSSSFSDIAPAPIRHASSFSSYSTPSVTTTATTADADADKDETATPSFIYHASPSLSASGLPSSSPRLQNGQGPPGRSHSYQEEDGQQDQDNVPRSRSTSLDYSDLAPQHHQLQHQQQHQGTTHTRNVRKRPSPSIPSKDGETPSSSSSSWWESPLTQQHAQSESSRFSSTRAFSPTLTRHHLYHHYHHQCQRSPPSSSSSSSSTSLTSVFSSVVPGSTAQQSGGGSATEGTASRGSPSTETAAISEIALPGPSQTTTPPTSFSTSSSSISSSSISSLPSSSATSFVVQDEQRRSVDRRNKRHMNLRAMMKERALLGDREAMEYVEYSHELARRGCWPVDLDQDFGMGASYYHHHQRTFDERGSSRDYYTNAEVAAAFGMQEMNDLPMDVDGGVDTDECMQCDSTTPIPMMTKSSSSYLPDAPVVSLQQQTNNKNNTSSSSSSMEPQLPTDSSPLSIASHSSSFANWSVLPEREKDRENESAFRATPLGISVPLIETNTNGSGGTGRWNGSGNGSGRSGGDGGSLSTWRMGMTSELSSSSLFSQDVSFRHPRGENNQQQQQSQSLRLRAVLPTNTTSNNTSTTAPSSTSTTTTATTRSATTNTGTQQKMQQILNRNDKIAFLTQYTDRMHQKLQALGIEDWGQGDIQRKKTYQLMIQHNDKTGEKDLVKFYLGRYGGSTTTTSGDAGGSVQEPGGPLGLTLPLSVQQQQGQEQQGTPLVAQA